MDLDTKMPAPFMKKAYFLFVVFLLGSIFAVPRIVGLDKFVSLDESYWIREGANFYYALGQLQFEKTVFEYNPAITDLWCVAAGMLVYFPKYRGLGQGYLNKGRFDLFLPKYGKSDLGLLFYGRLVKVVLIVIGLLIAFYLLRDLFGNRAALFTITLISLSPFFLGFSRVLNQEATMGLLILISLLSLTIHLFKKRNFLLLMLSATAGGLAQLSKSSGFLLFPTVGLILIFYLIETRDEFSWHAVLAALKTLGAWIVMLVAAYFLFWPGMWVAPGVMLNQVYGNALSYAFLGGRLSVTGGLTPTRFSLTSGLDALGQIGTFILQMLWHSTPLTWIGFILGILALFFYKDESSKHVYKWVIVYLLIIAALFIAFFSVARGRVSQHYILTSYMCVDTIAGLGWSFMLILISDKWPEKIRGWILGSILIALIAFQGVSVLASYPYYYTYLDPLMEVAPSAKNILYDYPSYGEGLDQVAAYLSQKPAASKLTVTSYCGYGCLSYLFDGTALTINDLPLVNTDPVLIGDLRISDYVVLDHQLQEAQNDLAGFEGITPEKIIWINEVEHIDIYRAADLLQRVNSNLH
jgi:Dolichyl-phosphate-mannose-protein mannosyltransferase